MAELWRSRSRCARRGSEDRAGISGVPYPVYVFAGLLPWVLFCRALTSTINSILASGGIITKVYIPRLIVSIATVGIGVIDFA
jgi:lipopolysaccharide transport system permease protein